MFPSQVSCSLAEPPPPRQAFDPAQIRGIREDPRMAEQQFGNLQDAAQVLCPPPLTAAAERRAAGCPPAARPLWETFSIRPCAVLLLRGEAISVCWQPSQRPNGSRVTGGRGARGRAQIRQSKEERHRYGRFFYRFPQAPPSAAARRGSAAPCPPRDAAGAARWRPAGLTSGGTAG